MAVFRTFTPFHDRDIKDVFSLSITAIKDIMNDNIEKENDEIINNFPPEVILPETE